jgi:hypothetical protein
LLASQTSPAAQFALAMHRPFGMQPATSTPDWIFHAEHCSVVVLQVLQLVFEGTHQ